MVELYGPAHLLLLAWAFRLLASRIRWSGFSAPYTQYSILVLFGEGLKIVTAEDTQACLATRNFKTMLLLFAPCQYREMWMMWKSWCLILGDNCRGFSPAT
jgi:hypothetical protein